MKALADTGAGGYLFIDQATAIRICKRFGHGVKRLKEPLTVRGFNGSVAPAITHYIRLNLWVEGRRFRHAPMLIAPLGQHDLIIGRNWLADKDIWLDVRNQRLIWPEDRAVPTQEEVVQRRQMPVVPTRILKRSEKIDPSHQADADRRDRKLERPYQPHRTEAMDRREAEQKMKRAFQSSLREPFEAPLPKVKRKEVILPENIDIAFVGGPGFDRTARKKDAKLHVISLKEIDALINEKKLPDEPDAELIRKNLPAAYQDYIDVFSKRASDQLPPYRAGVDCKIKLEDDPVRAVSCQPLRKMSLLELEAAKAYLIDNLEKGFIVPSDAPFASPILMAYQNGKYRFCVDFRRLNMLTTKDRYPLPLIDELLERLSHARIFTKLDVRQGFHRIRMASPGDEDLTTFRTRYGQFKYRVMPFGLTNGPAVFQRFMNSILLDCLDKFVTAFMDDLLIYSQNQTEHEAHVKTVLQRLRKAGLQASITKCEFNVTRTKYLGYIISTEGIAVDQEKAAVIQGWQRPSTVKGVQSFLGFCNFYRRFLKGYSALARPLTRLTKKDVPFVWDQQCERAFRELKAGLVGAPLLRHFRPELPTKLETDASDGTVAAALSQLCKDGLWHPIGFFSKTMVAAEINYDIHDKEMLAIIRALEEWRAELQSL
jgi:hypothetical protein